MITSEYIYVCTRIFNIHFNSTTFVIICVSLILNVICFFFQSDGKHDFTLDHALPYDKRTRDGERRINPRKTDALLSR